jgi:hypothetical protein
MKQKICAFTMAATLLAASALVAKADTIITNPAGLTTKTFNSSGSDGAGNTIALGIGSGFFLNFGGEVLLLYSNPASAIFTFASPLTTFGFDENILSGYAWITGVALSNGDTLTTSVPYTLGASGFYGITSATSFNSATVTFDVSNGSMAIQDFRLSTAPTAPEPATWALIAPLLLAGLGVLRLRRRAVR